MFSVIALVVFGWAPSGAQELEAEVPGDNFSLEGALDLFKKSASPEEFEKLLNSPDSRVNNLDLNGDGFIDYIRVIDRYEGHVHVFILQAIVSSSQNQDIAVIELEKLGDGKAVLQIVGNADIYGVETIIEPTREVRTYAGTRTSRTVVNVWAWPSVQFIYAPYYTAWISPWGWHVRPVWWHRWRPVAYVYYYPVWQPYRDYYAPCYTRRVTYAHNIYYPHRTTSVIVHDRHHSRIARYRAEHKDRDVARRNSRSSSRDRERENDDQDRRSSRSAENSNYERTRSVDPVVRGSASDLNRTPVRERTSAGRGTPRSTDNAGFDRVESGRGAQVQQRPAREQNRTSTSSERRSTSSGLNTRDAGNGGSVDRRPQINTRTDQGSRSSDRTSLQRRPERSAPASIRTSGSRREVASPPARTVERPKAPRKPEGGNGGRSIERGRGN